MKLYEFQAKEVFAGEGIPVPRGQMASTPAEAEAIARELGRCVVKAQVHVGGRGKAGGVKVVNTREEARVAAEGMLGKPLKGLIVHHVLVEEALQIASEYYLSVIIDRTSKRPVMMASAMGGVDIEEVAATTPERIARLVIDPAYGPLDFELRKLSADAGFDPRASRGVVDIARRLYRVFVRTDASLAEINPLVVTDRGAVIAADAKFDVDDNALYRQQALARFREESEEDEIEAQAHRRGVNYVRLPGGDIGIIGNGAGLVMSTLDLVTRHGGKPANFLDVGGGASAESVREALSIVLMDPNVKGVLFNIFGGITRGDLVAQGILDAVSTMDIKVPMVVRMAGTRAKEGLALLEGSPLTPAAGPAEAAERVIELAHKR
ncbi:MAG TPA: ADP-forming succinate--CoA ligase subunit beta [Chloroflexota bacterium]|nr:ADP-forming succinate--CoA ligase subunit beta [Chloroflexota bacterium]